MTRKDQRIEGQSQLFAIGGENSSAETPQITTWQQMESDPYARLEALAGDNKGPHVVIAERAENLVHAMNALAHRNKLEGFDVAVNDGRYKKPIWERYLDITPKVVELSQSKVDRLEDEAADHFWHAMGFEALRGTRLLKKGEVKSRSSKMWRDFSAEIGSPKVHDDLVGLRDLQKKHLPKDHPLRQKKKRSPKTVQERAA